MVNPQSSELKLTEEEFKLFQDLIEEQSGLYFDKRKASSLEVPLHIRASLRGFKNFKKYYDFLKYTPEGEEEFKELLNLITVNETSFFRSPSDFTVLKEHILPEIIRKRQQTGRTIRIWSAGCSTGEEAYTIAIILLEVVNLPETCKIEIWATDVNKKALEAAKEGIYSQRSLRLTDRAYVDKYFEKMGDKQYRLREEVRKMVHFTSFNLADESHYPSMRGPWDVIFCRNVIIYFRPETAKRIIHHFYESLKEEGYLFLGYSESLYNISDEFKLIEINGTFLSKKEEPKAEEQRLKEGSKGLGSVLGGEEVVKRAKPHSPKVRPSPKQEYKEEENIEGLYDKASGYFKEERFDQTLIWVKKVLETNPYHLEARLLLGRLYADGGRHEEAINEFKRAIEIDSLSAVAHFLLGLIYNDNERGDRMKAIHEFKNAVYIDKNFALAHFNLANIFKSLGKWRKAIREYSNTIKTLEFRPKEEVMEFSGGFTNQLLIQICEKNMDLCQKKLGTA